MKVSAVILKANFQVALNNAVQLGFPPATDQGFDDSVFRSLMRLSAVYPNLNTEMVQETIQEFNRQLNGTNARVSLGEIMSLITQAQHSHR